MTFHFGPKPRQIWNLGVSKRGPRRIQNPGHQGNPNGKFRNTCFLDLVNSFWRQSWGGTVQKESTLLWGPFENSCGTDGSGPVQKESTSSGWLPIETSKLAAAVQGGHRAGTREPALHGGGAQGPGARGRTAHASLEPFLEP